MSAPSDPGSLMTIIVVIVTVAMIFWRSVIRLTIIACVALAVLGLHTFLQGLH